MGNNQISGLDSHPPGLDHIDHLGNVRNGSLPESTWDSLAWPRREISTLHDRHVLLFSTGNSGKAGIGVLMHLFLHQSQKSEESVMAVLHELGGTKEDIDILREVGVIDVKSSIVFLTQKGIKLALHLDTLGRDQN